MTDPVKYTSEEIERLLRNLRDTSYNEGSVDLACRCRDALGVITQLQTQISFASYAERATKMHDSAVRVCHERDIECGPHPDTWCHACPNRARTSLAAQMNKETIELIRDTLEGCKWNHQEAGKTPARDDRESARWQFQLLRIEAALSAISTAERAPTHGDVIDELKTLAQQAPVAIVIENGPAASIALKLSKYITIGSKLYLEPQSAGKPDEWRDSVFDRCNTVGIGYDSENPEFTLDELIHHHRQVSKEMAEINHLSGDEASNNAQAIRDAALSDAEETVTTLYEQEETPYLVDICRAIRSLKSLAAQQMQKAAKSLRDMTTEDFDEAHGITPPAQEPKNEWREAVLALCEISHLSFREGDPKKTLNDILSFEVSVALDPRVNGGKVLMDAATPPQSGHSFCAGVVVTEYAHPKMEHDFDDAVPHNLDSSHYWMDRYKAAEETIAAYEKSRQEIPVPSLEFWLERKGATRHGAETWLISNDGIKKIYDELCAMWEINQGFVNALQGDKRTEDKK